MCPHHPPESLELRLKRINRRGNRPLENLKRFQQERFVWKRYVDFVLRIDIDISTALPDSRKNFFRLTLHRAFAASNDCVTRTTSTNGYQFPMFVWVGNITEGFRPCDSVVGLQTLNLVDMPLVQSAQVSFRAGLKAALFVFGIERDIFDEELRSVLTTAGIVPREFVDEVIEGRTQIVNDLTNYDRHIDGNGNN